MYVLRSLCFDQAGILCLTKFALDVQGSFLSDIIVFSKLHKRDQSSTDDRLTGKVAAKGPFEVELIQGKRYSWCRCGYSDKQVSLKLNLVFTKP